MKGEKKARAREPFNYVARNGDLLLTNLQILKASMWFDIVKPGPKAWRHDTILATLVVWENQQRG
jgi:hypothetical protein